MTVKQLRKKGLRGSEKDNATKRKEEGLLQKERERLSPQGRGWLYLNLEIVF